MTKRIALLWVLALSAGFLAGCNKGPSLATVTGRVTLDGEPAEGLQVEFLPKDGSAGATSLGFTRSDGTYELHYPGEKTGAVPGEYIVRIQGAETDGESPPKIVAPKYNTASELTAKVEPGVNKLDFEVTSK